jgi:cbb3-type cytochrome oxidase subunit 3
VLQTEIVQFVGALILFLGILVGSYWFVYAPVKASQRRENERREASD